jgi:multiple sugar transport system permease protein
MSTTHASNRRLLVSYSKTLVASIIAVIILFPLIWAVLASFRPTAEFFVPLPTLFPQNWTFHNYASLGNQLGPLFTTLIVATLSAIFSVAIAVPAAYALSAFRWKITGFALFLILVTQIVPTVMLATPLYLTFSKIGLLNSIPGLVIANSSAGVPFAILVLTAFMSDFPKELREAAFIDGAGEWRTLISVVLPPSRTALISAGLFSFLFAWADFLWAVTLNTKGTIVPLTLSIYEFIGNNQVNWGYVMATGTVAIIPGLILLVAAQKYVSAGLTSGAVKD